MAYGAKPSLVRTVRRGHRVPRGLVSRNVIRPITTYPPPDEPHPPREHAYIPPVYHAFTVCVECRSAISTDVTHGRAGCPSAVHRACTSVDRGSRRDSHPVRRKTPILEFWRWWTYRRVERVLDGSRPLALSPVESAQRHRSSDQSILTRSKNLRLVYLVISLRDEARVRVRKERPREGNQNLNLPNQKMTQGDLSKSPVPTLMPSYYSWLFPHDVMSQVGNSRLQNQTPI